MLVQICIFSFRFCVFYYHLSKDLVWSTLIGRNETKRSFTKPMTNSPCCGPFHLLEEGCELGFSVSGFGILRRVNPGFVLHEPNNHTVWLGTHTHTLFVTCTSTLSLCFPSLPPHVSLPLSLSLSHKHTHTHILSEDPPV